MIEIPLCRQRARLRRIGTPVKLLVALCASPVHGWLPARCPRLPTHGLFHIYSYSNSPFSLSSSNKDEGNGKKHKHLQDDISKRLSISKDRAISAQSQSETSQRPKRSDSHKGKGRRNKAGSKKEQPSSGSRNATGSLLPPPNELSEGTIGSRLTEKQSGTNSRNKSATGVQSNEARGYTSQLSKTTGERFRNPRGGVASKNRRVQSKPEGSTSYSSLLPPPLLDSSFVRGNNNDDDLDDSVSSGLSSWEQFLGMGASGSGSDDYGGSTSSGGEGGGRPSPLPRDDLRLTDPSLTGGDFMASPDQQRLPPIQDLFPPDLSVTSTSSKPPSPSAERFDKGSSLDGVLPVSDLFYRSSQSQEEEDDEHDDEELPFSAEQSDAISSDQNKIRIRRNLAKQPQLSDVVVGKQRPEIEPPRLTVEASVSPVATSASSTGFDRSRKMVRRGMEMLVGGVPINADPPQRSVQLMYEYPPEGGAGYDWASTIASNTRDFGPLLHAGSISKVSDFERGLFCEYFCQSATKWDICPKDLRQITKTHRAKVRATKGLLLDDSEVSPEAALSQNEDQKFDTQPAVVDNKVSQDFDETMVRLAVTSDESDVSGEDGLSDSRSKDGDDENFETTGEFSFEIGVSQEELESGEGGPGGGIFRAVFARAFMSVLERVVDGASKDESENFIVEIPKLTLTETDDGYTTVTVDFKVEAGFSTSYADMERKVKRIGSVFTQAMDDGDIAMAIAAAAKEEMRWPEAVRNRVVEECLFQDEYSDDPTQVLWTRDDTPLMYDSDLGTAVPARIGDGRTKGALYLGGGDDGVFFDYSAANAQNAPYSGEIGLRLVDAVTERAKQRQPKVIAIGDVHGCIDELQDLLRQCDYRPGDLVVFLGDLVCKGPDSISVVQMAREIGAIGVRGNHDFEVVRWHQAIKSGVDPPVFGSEHFHIASCLSKADMKWMHSLPWYISSKDLGALFVHAGFVSGIRLAKQNPRLMMNMRSILPDGTVTSKFFNNWPWARLWDGPQTVLFGHDADRGLQQYEHAIGLDTGCVYGGRLTACILPEKRLVSVSARREYFKYRRKHYD